MTLDSLLQFFTSAMALFFARIHRSKIEIITSSRMLPLTRLVCLDWGSTDILYS